MVKRPPASSVSAKLTWPPPRFDLPAGGGASKAAALTAPPQGPAAADSAAGIVGEREADLAAALVRLAGGRGCVEVGDRDGADQGAGGGELGDRQRTGVELGRIVDRRDVHDCAARREARARIGALKAVVTV